MALIFDDFNYGRLDAEDWAEIQGGSVQSGFMSGAHSLFFGAADEIGQQRFAESAVVDISTGATVSFDLIFGSDFNGGNNASPGQDVVLEYSTDGGTTWTILETYDTEDYADWSTPIIEDVPAEALSNATQFRWRQQGTSTPGTNNWALDDVTVTGTALASQTSIFDDFNYSTIDPGIWAEIKGGTVQSGLSSGAHTLFFGSPSDGGGQRSIESVPMDVRDGGTVSFELKFGNDLNGGENANPGEDVVLEYSTDRGDTWVPVNTYDSEDYSYWTRINENVPDAALSDATRFRLRQVSFDVDSSAITGLDNWGVDNFRITDAPIVPPTEIFDDFDTNTIDWEDWVDIKGGTVTVRSGFSVGAHTLFFGSSNDEGGQRLIESVPMDVSQGGIVSFELIFGDEFNGGDNAEPGEDVVLEYSIDDGENWVLVDTYDTEDYTHWTRVNAYVPDEGLTSSTSFRLRQLQFDADLSETGVDNWGLNNFSITGAPIVSPTEIFDNFDYSTPDTDDWADIKGGSVRSGFSSGAHTLFFGSSGDEGGQRLIESIPIDVSAGGTVSFEIIFGDDLNGGENANPGEDVVLEYSVDDGENWVLVDTYDTEDYTHWTRINQDVPEPALTSDTRFRLRQLQFDLDSSATGVDNWGLNDFGIVGTGVATQTSLFDNFDYGTADADDWVDIKGGSVQSGFSSGAHTLFFGSSSDGGGQRLIESVPVNVRSGGTVSFEIIFGDGFNGEDDADPGEDVVLEYSIDDGENWVLINTYGTENYTSWTKITENIPAAASTGNTKFRLRQIAFDQVNTSENGEDNWGLNDFAVTPSITAVPPDIDLVIDSVTTETTEAIFGEDLEISWVVRNQGTEATTTSWLDRIYLSTDESLGSDDIALGSLPSQKSELAPGESYSQTLTVDLPIVDGFTDGTYQILVNTDDVEGQTETLEDNNISTASLEIGTRDSGDSAVADGSFIQPDTAVASSQYSRSYQATNTIDGSGLSDPLLGSNAIHDPYSYDNHWTSARGTAPRDQLIDWGFNTPQNLDEIYIWNHQSNPGIADNPGYEVTLFDLTLFDAADNILLTLDDVALQPDTNAAQTFSFGQTVANVSRVRFEIEDVQSSTTYTGLAEVGFRGV